MNQILNRNTFLFKEKVRVFGASNQFNIYNPENQEVLMTCNETGLGFFVN